MATAVLRKRLALLEQRHNPAGRSGIIRIPHCHPAEYDALVDRVIDDLPDGSGVAIVPACSTSDAEWDQGVAWCMEWQEANKAHVGRELAMQQAWNAAIAEGRARVCEPCGKKFIRDTQICPGCHRDTERVT